MKRSDEIIQNSFGRTLTASERHELREVYNWEQKQDEQVRGKVRQSVKDFKDDKNNLNMPRHRMHYKCPSFRECPIDYKCRSFNPAHLACINCELHETDDICKKDTIHTERNYSMIISRERIDLDGEKV